VRSDPAGCLRPAQIGERRCRLSAGERLVPIADILVKRRASSEASPWLSISAQQTLICWRHMHRIG
jgi:hypothetical protein